MRCFLALFRTIFFVYGLLFIGLGGFSSLCAKETPKLECEIAEYRLFEKIDKEGNDREIPLIALKTSGLPEQTPVILKCIRLDNTSDTYKEKFIVGKKGYLTLEANPERPHLIGMCNMLLGEPLRFEIYECRKRSKTKRKALAKDSIVIYPMGAIGDDGRYVSLTLKSPDRKHFLFEGREFKPFEHVYMISKSEGGTLTSEFNVSKDGTFQGLISPAVIGKKWGEASLSFRTTTNEQVALEYVWGWPLPSD